MQLTRGPQRIAIVLLTTRIMPLLFSYGDLQRESVQLSTFGRLLVGQPDELVGFKPSLVAIEDAAIAARLGKSHHANVVASSNDGNRVAGVVFEVSDAELANADRFEAPYSYARIFTTLASGRGAWVYVHVSPPDAV